jgi:hypothetical protein
MVDMLSFPVPPAILRGEMVPRVDEASMDIRVPCRGRVSGTSSVPWSNWKLLAVLLAINLAGVASPASRRVEIARA